MRRVSIIAVMSLAIGTLLLTTRMSVAAQENGSSKSRAASSQSSQDKSAKGEDKFDPEFKLNLIVKIEAGGQIFLNAEDMGSINNTAPLTSFLTQIIRRREEQLVMKPGTEEFEKTVWVVASPAINDEVVEEIVQKVKSTGANPVRRLTEREYNEARASDEPSAKPRAPVRGGVLNGKAISKPMPPYPPIAKAARASGLVTVQITIDEEGKVISAYAVGGHPLLQQAAVQAAYQARFSPTRLSGVPVKVMGVLTYNFILK
jgi:TonB family protein